MFPAQALFSPRCADSRSERRSGSLGARGRGSTPRYGQAAELAVAGAGDSQDPETPDAGVLAVAGVFVVVSPDVHTPAELALRTALPRWIGLPGVFAGGSRAITLAYALILWVAALRAPLGQLFGAANPALETQGWIVAAAMALTIVWAAYPGAKRAISLISLQPSAFGCRPSARRCVLS